MALADLSAAGWVDFLSIRNLDRVRVLNPQISQMKDEKSVTICVIPGPEKIPSRLHHHLVALTRP